MRVARCGPWDRRGRRRPGIQCPHPRPARARGAAIWIGRRLFSYRRGVRCRHPAWLCRMADELRRAELLSDGAECGADRGLDGELCGQPAAHHLRSGSGLCLRAHHAGVRIIRFPHPGHRDSERGVIWRLLRALPALSGRPFASALAEGRNGRLFAGGRGASFDAAAVLLPNADTIPALACLVAFFVVSDVRLNDVSKLAIVTAISLPVFFIKMSAAFLPFALVVLMLAKRGALDAGILPDCGWRPRSGRRRS